MLAKQLLLLSFFVLMLNVNCRAQGTVTDPRLAEPVVSTPEATSITKFGSVPVDYKTGVPDISIPLYNLRNHEIEIPVSIRYHASGIKVRDIGSSVGLGWSLSAGGVITGTVNGKPDVTSTGFDNFTNLSNHLASSDLEHLYLAEEHNPDFYTFSFLNRSGKFFIKNGFHISPAQTLEIANATGGVPGFIITDENGLVYEFTTLDIQKVESTCAQGDLWNPAEEVPMSFYLTRITSPTGRVVTFHYKDYTYEYYADFSQTKSLSAPGAPPPSTCWTKIRIVQGKIIERIESDDGQHVIFEYSGNGRPDLPYNNTLGKLETVSVVINGVPINSFALTHNQISCNVPVPDDMPSSPHDFFTGGHQGSYRMLLESIQEQGKQPYRFDYNLDNKPSRFSLGVDHWGYYNGATNKSMIPRGSYGLGNMDGADRDASEPEVKAFLLKKITYPLGGSTSFHFEANKKVGVLEAGEVIVNYGDETLLCTGDDICERSITIPPDAQFIRMYYWTNSPNTEMLEPVHGEPFSMTLVYWDDQNGEQSMALTGNGSEDHVFSNALSAGSTYRFRIQTLGIVSGNGVISDAPVTTGIRVTWREQETSATTTEEVTQYFGGVRVASITDNPNANISPDNHSVREITKYYEYIIPSDFTNKFQYDYYTYIRSETAPDGVQHVTRSSSSIIPIQQVPFTMVSVSERVVKLATTDDPVMTTRYNGKTEYYYSYVNNTIHYTLGQAFAAVTDENWQAGDLYKEVVYSHDGNAFNKLEQRDFNYSLKNPRNAFIVDLPYGAHEFHFYGIRVSRVKQKFEGASGFLPAEYHYEVFKLSTDFKYLDKIITTRFFNNTPVVTSIKEFSYQNSMLLSEEQETSAGKTYLIQYKRVADYPLSFSNLQAKNMKAAIIEKRKFLLRNDTTYMLVGDFYEYYEDKPVVKHVLKANFTEPYPFEAYLDHTTPMDPELIAFYKTERTFFYNARLNLNSVQPENHFKSSFLYGYTGDLPIAKVVNADSEDIFHTSFEGTDGSAFIDNDLNQAYTGQKVLNGGNYYINTTEFGSTATGLKMSYWFFHDNAWKFSGELPFNRQITTTGTRLDEIRVYPSGAQITTYTHRPGFGISSVCDPNGNSLHYEYDPVSHELILVRDKNKNIINRYRYNYYED